MAETLPLPRTGTERIGQEKLEQLRDIMKNAENYGIKDEVIDIAVENLTKWRVILPDGEEEADVGT